MGLFPQLFFKYSKASLNHLNKNQYHYSLSFYKKKSGGKKKEFLKRKEVLQKSPTPQKEQLDILEKEEKP